MKIRRAKRRAPYVPTASFGDIAFLLIIFFMVASVFMREAHIKSTPAAAPDIEKVEEGSVSVVLDTEGVIWVQGEKCAPDALEPAVSALLQDVKDKKVIVKIDKAQVQENFGVVLKALSGAGADIVLIGEKREKTK